MRTGKLSVNVSISANFFDLLRCEFSCDGKKNMLLWDLDELIWKILRVILYENLDRIDYYQRYWNIITDYNAEQMRKLLSVMESDVPYTAAHIMTALGLKSKENLRKLYIAPAMEKGLIVMGMPDKPSSRNQTYIKRNC